MKFANPKNTVQIQSVGLVAGKPAADFKAGEKMLWNFGMTSTVIRTERETAKTIWIEMQSDKTGTTFVRQFKKTRVVAIG